MIRLKNNISTKMCTSYFTKMYSIIEKRALAEKNNFEKAFPEAYDGNNVNKEFFYDVLCLPIDKVISKYKSIKIYYQLRCISAFNMVEKCKQCGDKTKYPALRESFINKHNNPVVNTLKSGCSGSIDKYKKFVKKIRKHCDNSYYKEIDKVISYEFIDSKYRHEIMGILNVNVCPYCNRQYITLYNEDNKRKTTADLDHLLPKDNFKLFSLSLYNFIPSCQICNMRFKKDKYIEMISPYDRGYDSDAYFGIKKKGKVWDASTLLGWKGDFNITLKYNETSKDIESIKSEAKLFKIDEVYQSHKEYVKELLLKRNAFSKSFKNEIKVILNKNGHNLTDSEIDKLIYGQDLNDTDFSRKPLSKLTYDILCK